MAIADDDLAAAGDLLAGGRAGWVLFACQQAMEKALKALLTRQKGQLPPRTHDLLALARESGLELPMPLATLLADLTVYYTQARYPDRPSGFS